MNQNIHLLSNSFFNMKIYLHLPKNDFYNKKFICDYINFLIILSYFSNLHLIIIIFPHACYALTKMMFHIIFHIIFFNIIRCNFLIVI